VRQLGRQAYKRRNDPADPAHEAYRSKRNAYASAIEKSKREHWENFLEGIDQKTVWTAHRYASADTTDGGCTRIPTLKQVQADGSVLTAETNTDKADMLYGTFFPKPGNEVETIPAQFQYPTPAFDYQPITDAQIRRAIDKLNSFKAPGANGIPNIVWKQCANVLLPYIGPLFRSTFMLQIYPTQWKDSITKVLRKPGKADYTAPGAYRPIALLDMLGKILSACVAEDIIKMAERHMLLPDHHYGCRPGRTTTDAIHYAVKAAKDAQRRGKVLGALFLDIKGAFPSVILERLTHNMRCRGIPKEYTDWIRTKVEGRCTVLSFDDFNTEAIRIGKGLDQGCPLSAVAYLFYNADLLEIAKGGRGESVIGFVDDTTLLAEGDDLESAFGKLTDMMTRAGGAQEWARDHDCTFAPDKFGLMGFTRKREKDPTMAKKTRPLPRPTVRIGQHVIQPTTSHKFLGVLIDQELRFKEHANYALQKGNKWMGRYRRLAKVSKGGHS
jgi:hypothetical protein